MVTFNGSGYMGKRMKKVTFDSRAFSASAKTLVEYPEERITINGRTVMLRRATVTTPGYFVDGKLEVWSACIGAGSLALMGARRSAATEVVAYGDTREQVVANAESALAKRGK